jgi:hypothetical protein
VLSPHHHQQKRARYKPYEAPGAEVAQWGEGPTGAFLIREEENPARAPNSPKQAPGTNIGSSNQHLIALSCGTTSKSLRGFMAVHVLPKEWSSWSVPGPRDTRKPRGMGVGILVPISSLLHVCVWLCAFFQLLGNFASQKSIKPHVADPQKPFSFNSTTLPIP